MARPILALQSLLILLAPVLVCRQNTRCVWPVDGVWFGVWHAVLQLILEGAVLYFLKLQMRIAMRWGNPAGPCRVKAMGCFLETLLLYIPVVVTFLPERKSILYGCSYQICHRPLCLLLFYFPAPWGGRCLSPLLAKLRDCH